MSRVSYVQNKAGNSVVPVIVTLENESRTAREKEKALLNFKTFLSIAKKYRKRMESMAANSDDNNAAEATQQPEEGELLDFDQPASFTVEEVE